MTDQQDLTPLQGSYRQKQVGIFQRFQGWPLIPIFSPTTAGGCKCGDSTCRSQGKHPKVRGWRKTKAGTDPAGRIKENDNVGVVTGNGLLVVDVDDKGGRNGADSLRKLEEEHGKLPRTFAVKTSSGFHFYFRVIGDVPNSVDLLGSGIDIRGDGGFAVLPPSKHISGVSYEIYQDEGIAEAPSWLVERAKGRRVAYPNNVKRSAGPIIAGGRNVELCSIAGTMARVNASPKAILAALLQINSDQCVPPLPEEEVRKIAASSNKFMAEMQTWRASLQVKISNQGNPIPLGNVTNVALFLTCHEKFAGLFGWDVWQHKAVMMKDPPSGLFLPDRDKFSIDDDWVYIQALLTSEGLRISDSNVIKEGIRVSARQCPIDPVRDYLNEISWDGERRLATWLAVYLGAHGAPEEYLKLVGTKFMLSAIARALDPGCKVDTTLVLEGPQGVGKSTAVRILGGEKTGEGHIYLNDKYAGLACENVWFFELGELSVLRERSLEQLKQFLTQQYDKVRRPYDREESIIPRRCVFVGTTNDDDYLIDSANRRFWPVKVGRVSRDALARDRDQLFAEAVYLYRQGISWHVDAEDSSVKAEQSQRRASDPWVDVLSEACTYYCKNNRDPNTWFLSNNDLYSALDLSPRDRGSGRRLPRVMQRLGWEKTRKNNIRGFRPSEEWVAQMKKVLS